MSLHCLVYTSVANQKMSMEELKALLNKSRAKNERLSITGMLLHLDPFFIQVLEGDEAIVDQAFSIIKHDPRHHHVYLIYKKAIANRTFANWTMGFNAVGHENLHAITGFSDFLQQPTTRLLNSSPSAIEQLLTMFKNETLF